MRSLARAVAPFCVLMVNALLHAAADPAVTITTTDDYRSAWLQLERGGLRFIDKQTEPVDVPLFLGLRGGKVVVG